MTVIVFFSYLGLFFFLSTAVMGDNAPFPNSQFLQIGEISFHYRQWIPQEEPAGFILLIHGLGGSTFSFRHNVKPLLGKGYQILAVDLPAFGYSDRRRGLVHSQENRSQWLWELIHQVTPVDSSWHLVGHSMGGGTITAMALENPEGVSSLTYIAGAVNGAPPSRGRILRYPPFRQIFTFVARSFLFRRWMIERVLTSAYGTTPSEEEIQGYLKPMQIKGTASAWADLVGSVREPYSPRLEMVSIPALLIWGEKDSWVPVETGEGLTERLQASRLVVLPGVGHCPHETHPEKVNEYLLDFLRDPQAVE